MAEAVPRPHQVVGVDFSGAQDAGRHIWLSTGRIEAGTLRIEACLPLTEFPHTRSGRRPHALSALSVLLRQFAHCAVGLDAPLSLPQVVLGDDGWRAFIDTFQQRFPDPESFQRYCREAVAAAGSAKKEVRRRTEQETKAPFCAFNRRLYRMTFYALRDVVSPLVRADEVRVIPMQEPAGDTPWLLETCPAGTLKRLDLYEPYKDGDNADRAEARERIVVELLSHQPLVMTHATVRTLVEQPGGDALDSVLCALAAFGAMQTQEDLVAAPDSDEAIEGRIFI